MPQWAVTSLLKSGALRDSFLLFSVGGENNLESRGGKTRCLDVGSPTRLALQLVNIRARLTSLESDQTDSVTPNMTVEHARG